MIKTNLVSGKFNKELRERKKRDTQEILVALSKMGALLESADDVAKLYRPSEEEKNGYIKSLKNIHNRIEAEQAKEEYQNYRVIKAYLMGYMRRVSQDYGLHEELTDINDISKRLDKVIKAISGASA